MELNEKKAEQIAEVLLKRKGKLRWEFIHSKLSVVSFDMLVA